MIVKASVRLGLVGCTIEDEIDIPDEELEDMTEAKRTNYIDDIVREWMFEQIEWGWEKQS